MPRAKRLRRGTAFQQVQRQARALLVSLRTEIRSKEAELSRLTEEESTLDRLSGDLVRPAVNGRTTRGGGGSRGRVDWRVILQQLPKQFKASDVRGIRSVKEKRPSEIFAAITRWIEAGMVKRKSRGVYERA
jgi:hypothetical protein